MKKNEEIISSVHQGVSDFCKNNFVWDFNPEAPVVRLHEPTFGAEEINAAISQMLTTQVTMGKEVRRFEEQLVQDINSPEGLVDRLKAKHKQQDLEQAKLIEAESVNLLEDAA